MQSQVGIAVRAATPRYRANRCSRFRLTSNEECVLRWFAEARLYHRGTGVSVEQIAAETGFYFSDDVRAAIVVLAEYGLLDVSGPEIVVTVARRHKAEPWFHLELLSP